MSILSLPQLAQEIVDLNRRVYSLAIEPSPEGNEDAASRQRRAARSARQLTRFTLNRASDARDTWRAVLELMGDGVAGEEARALVRIARDGMESWLALAQKVRAAWRDVQAPADAPGDLDAAEAEIKALQAEADKVHGFLCRARRPIDAERLRRGEDDAAQERVKKAEEVISRFQSPLK